MNSSSFGVTFDKVFFQYADTLSPVLKDVSFDIEAGEYTLIAGPSGSGKSTLLRCMNGLVPHFSGGTFGGNVIVCGEDSRYRPTRTLARVAGFVFQDADAVSATDRVDDEIAFGMEQLGVPNAIMKRRIEELLDAVGIASLRRRRLSTLSGGERQRVSIASALALNPAVLLLDEPTSQLDPVGAEEVLSAVRLVNSELDSTVVISEHRLERLLGDIDRMMVLLGSGNSEIGKPEDIIETMNVDLVPPLARLSRTLGWEITPLSVKQARKHVASAGFSPGEAAIDKRRPDNAPAIKLDRVAIERDGLTVLQNATFEVRSGEIVAMMGRNGSGKTTILKAIMNLLPIQNGAVRLLGADVSASNTQYLAQTAGYLPQRARSLLFHESVREELLASWSHRGAAGCDLIAYAQNFGLESMLEHHPFDLSVGEQERLALAVTMVGNPSVLLLDEPTRGMDYAHKSDLARMLQQRRDDGSAILIATHDVELVAGLATHIVLIGDGEIVAEGPPRQLLGDSITMAPQMTRLFGGGYLTVADVIQSLEAVSAVG